jgi:DNA polymerase elongation subunit (family B)
MSKKEWHDADIDLVVKMRGQGKTWVEISAKFPGSTPNAVRKLFYRETRDSVKARPVKVLLVDIETAPLEVYCWGLWDQNIALNQIIKDMSVLSWSAKWLGSKDIMYQDVRGQKDLRDDSKILKTLWELLDEADVVIGQNSQRFDVPILNARFIKNGFPPPSTFRQIDTLKIAKKNFRFTSNKLEYTTRLLNEQHQKLSHKKFPGFELWSECLKGNIEAFDEMEKYNKMDVISLEEYYNKLKPWDSTINWNVYTDEDVNYCSCGSTDFKKINKFHTTKVGRYQLYVCKTCGKTHQGKENLLDKDKRKGMLK